MKLWNQEIPTDTNSMTERLNLTTHHHQTLEGCRQEPSYTAATGVQCRDRFGKPPVSSSMIQQFHSYFPQTNENTRTPKHAEMSISACLVAQLRLTLCNPMDWSPPVSPVHGVFQARILETVSHSLFRGPGNDWTWVSWIAVGFFTVWATREPLIHTLSQTKHARTPKGRTAPKLLLKKMAVPWWNPFIRGLIPKRLKTMKHHRNSSRNQWVPLYRANQ